MLLPDEAPTETEGETVNLTEESSGKELIGGLVQLDSEVTEAQMVEVLTPYPSTSPPYPQTALQVNGDINVHRQEHTGSGGSASTASEVKQPPAPKPMDMAEKLKKWNIS